MFGRFINRFFSFPKIFSTRIINVAKRVAKLTDRPEILIQVESCFGDSDELAFDMLGVMIDEHDVNDPEVLSEMFKMVRDFKQDLDKSSVADYKSQLWYELYKDSYETE